MLHKKGFGFWGFLLGAIVGGIASITGCFHETELELSSELGALVVDTFTVKVQQKDSFSFMSSGRYMALGFLKDEYGGQVMGGFAAQVLLEKGNLDLSVYESIKIDSVVLEIPYYKVYGRGAISFSVYEAAEEIPPPTEFISTTRVATGPRIAFYEKWNAVEDFQYQKLRLSIDTQWFYKIFKTNGGKYQSDSEFTSIFRGLVFFPDAIVDGDGCGAYLDVNSTDARVRAFFRTSSGSAEEVSFLIGQNGRKGNMFWHDYSNSLISRKAGTITDTFLIGNAGLSCVKVTVPYFYGFLNKYSSPVVLRAVLKLKMLPYPYELFPPVQRIYISEGMPSPFVEPVSDVLHNLDIFNGKLNMADTSYEMNITMFVNRKIKEKAAPLSFYLYSGENNEGFSWSMFSAMKEKGITFTIFVVENGRQ